MTDTLVIGVCEPKSSIPTLLEEVGEGAYIRPVEFRVVRPNEGPKAAELIGSLRPRKTVVVVGATARATFIVPSAAVMGEDRQQWLDGGIYKFESHRSIELPGCGKTADLLARLADGQWEYCRYTQCGTIILEGNAVIGACLETRTRVIALLVPEQEIDGCFDEGFSKVAVDVVCGLILQ
ncbi:MAG: hypothetical protein BWY43_00083 [candidate division WS2 bacterium ADurb.Bin280]|uniref:Nucleoside phosphorylase domain-containing protein n=1 Tax=candidate division WS2 bacterium ADurb.Bin280 TaxID=1852829 RepID=A0A1V5SH37_9BACT|nr:MAG: hypothetical protein BWY43_00083 [candidate division WS2 bacterium ADurb.Bin280]